MHTFFSLQFSLMATFPKNILGILLFCGCVMVIGVIQVRMKCLYCSVFEENLSL